MSPPLYGTVEPLSQARRVPCSVPLEDADPRTGNRNWTLGLQAMSDWIWSDQPNPQPFRNHLARYFLQIPAVLEHQLHYSGCLIFDEPSFRDGARSAGMLPRPLREQVLGLVAMKRRSWYTMTHHAFIARLTFKKCGLSDEDFVERWCHLDEHRAHPGVYSRLERAALDFAEAFTTNPKEYTDAQYAELRAALGEDNERRHEAEGLWLEQLHAARRARSLGLLRGLEGAALDEVTREAARAHRGLSPERTEQLVNGQVVELAFMCLQFVALSAPFTALSIPDEDFLAEALKAVVPAPVITRTNALNEAGGKCMASLLPPPVAALPLQAILEGRVVVESARLQGARVPLEEGADSGRFFPASLTSALRHHPDLARFVPRYALPLLFNEDAWRSGTHTGGFVTSRLKAVVSQKVYRLLRCRSGLEHHTRLVLEDFLREHGAGAFRLQAMDDAEEARARARALERASAVLVHVHDHRGAPEGVFSPLERAAMDWTEEILTRPHGAHRVEPALREALDRENRREVRAGLRRLDMSLDGDSLEAAYTRLLHHQISELAMMIGHLDGLGRLSTLLKLGSEPSDVEGMPPSRAAETVGELLLNPRAAEEVLARLRSGEERVFISAEQAARTGEF